MPTGVVEGLLGGGGHRLGVEPAEAVEDLGRAPERVLHGVLLVEQHADEQRERALGEHAVCCRVLGNPYGHGDILAHTGLWNTVTHLTCGEVTGVSHCSDRWNTNLDCVRTAGQVVPGLGP